MRFRKKRFLGLAIGPKSISVAEVCVSGSRRRLIQATTFELPAGLTYQRSAEIGKALGPVLRQHGLGARDAVIGLPAQWLIFKAKTVPPAPPETLAGMLRLQAEREFSSDLSDLFIDYAEGEEGSEGRQVLLVAVLRRHIEQIRELAAAAGLNVAAVTASTMALASATVNPPGDALLSLFLGRTGTELAVTRGRNFRLVRHLEVAAAAADAPGTALSLWQSRMANEVRQSLSMLPHSGEQAPPRSILVWDGIGLNSDFPDGLTRELPLDASFCKGLELLGITGSPFSDELESRKFSQATALALTGLDRSLSSVDFEHSRLTVRPQRKFGRKVVWALVLSLAFAIGGYQMYSDWNAARQEVLALKGRMANLEPELEAARDIVERVSKARAWFDRRPDYLACLRDLTRVFPEKGSLWASTLTVQDDFRGVLSGKAIDQRSILQVIDRLKGSGAFSKVKVINMREAGRGSRTIAFSVSFLYKKGRAEK